MAFRYYQTEANDAVFDYWSKTAGNPLVVAATGTGKSMMQALLTTTILDRYADMRVMDTTHVQELVEGNFQELVKMRPFSPCGIWAASLGRADRRAQVLFSQIQTVHNKAKEIGHVDLLKIDEAHLVPFKQATMYRRLIDSLLEINPDMKVAGYTATPYRLDGGMLTEGDGRLFDDVVYDYGIGRGIEDGYLTPITSKPVDTNYNISGVGRSMGEYKAKEYREAVDTEELNRLVVEEVIATEGHRRKALIFCRGVEHAGRIRDEFKRQGKRVELVHGGTPNGERKRLIAALNSGELWGLVNDNILSTGTNIVGCDLIVDLYRTMSTNRYVQRVGRMTRVIYPPRFDPEAVSAEARRAAIASYLKPNGRYMDFAGNISEHGPVDMVQPKKPGSGTGEAPIKLCPVCEEICHASARTCHCCGTDFVFEEKPKFAATPTDAPIISTEAASWRPVNSRRFDYHEGKGGKPPSVKVSYMCGMTAIREWLCPQHTGFAKSKADRWWLAHGGERPFPKSVMEWLERQRELVETEEISVKPDGKYWTVVSQKAGTGRAHNDNTRPADNDNVQEMSPGLAEVLDDDIPF